MYQNLGSWQKVVSRFTTILIISTDEKNYTSSYEKYSSENIVTTICWGSDRRKKSYILTSI